VGNRVIRREATDPELRKREALEPVVRWWSGLPNRLEIICKRHRVHEDASGKSAVLRAFYLSGEATSREEVAAVLGWPEDRVDQERRAGISRVLRAYRAAHGGGNGRH